MSATTSPASHNVPAPYPIKRAAPAGHDEVERLSAKFHLIYQEEARRQGEVDHDEMYEDLDENVREFYRAQARYVLDHYFRR